MAMDSQCRIFILFLVNEQMAANKHNVQLTNQFIEHYESMEDVSKTLLEVAELYQTNQEIQKVQDSIYGEGAIEFFGKAIEAFYQHAPFSNK